MNMLGDSKIWTIELAIDEKADVTEAKAELRLDDRVLGGWGRPRRAPRIQSDPTSATSSRPLARCPILRTNSSIQPRPRSRGSRVTV